MARPLRIDQEDTFYHVLNRGHERRAIFRDDHDREKGSEGSGKWCGLRRDPANRGKRRAETAGSRLVLGIIRLTVRGGRRWRTFTYHENRRDNGIGESWGHFVCFKRELNVDYRI